VGALLVVTIGLLSGRGAAQPFKSRVFHYSVIAEVIGVALVLIFCIPLDQPSFIKPLIGAIVGLHFLPFAKAFEDRLFILAGALMIAVSLSALLWPSPARDAIAGLGGGIILWLFVLYASLVRKRDKTPSF